MIDAPSTDSRGEQFLGLTPSIKLTNCDTNLVDVTCSGYYTYSSGPRTPAPALQLQGGRLEIAGDRTIIAAGTIPRYGSGSAAAISTTSGTLQIAPTCSRRRR